MGGRLLGPKMGWEIAISVLAMRYCIESRVVQNRIVLNTPG